MDQVFNEHSVAPTVVLHFLQRTFPFSELDTSTLEHLARRTVIDHYGKGTIIFRQDVTDVTHFHIIQKGGVKAYLTSEDAFVSLRDYSGEGESFGALPIVSGQKADFNVEAVDDTFCFLIEREAFLEIVRDNPSFGKYYLETFSEDFVCAVYSELRHEKLSGRSEETFYLFHHRVRDIITQPPDIIDGFVTVQQAGVRMAELRVEALLVRDGQGEIVGQVSTRDFRTKVVAEGLDYSTPVEQIMTSPLHTIPAQASCFEALLRMIREQADHLVVEHRKLIVGVVSAHDIMGHQGASFPYHFRQIRTQRKITGLYSITPKIPSMVRTLMEEGARADNITKVITLFNDNLLNRLLTLLTEELGPSPVPFCWLVLGSEGRREQTFLTDQDNAVIYQDPDNGREQSEIQSYFRSFCRKAVEHLQACGYNTCRQKFMASNPRWCKPYSVWKGYFDEWILKPIPPEVILSRIFFDFRPSWGATALGERLRNHITKTARTGQRFLQHLAEDCLSNVPPVSVLGEFIVEKDGQHITKLDLKVRCLLPFVNFARLMALRYGIAETSTLGRLQLLHDRGRISRELFSDMRAAYEFQIQLTLVRQLRMLESGLIVQNSVRASELSDLERKTLKESFAVSHRMLERVRRDFT